jgi:hypothetical protein
MTSRFPGQRPAAPPSLFSFAANLENSIPPPPAPRSRSRSAASTRTGASALSSEASTFGRLSSQAHGPRGAGAQSHRANSRTPLLPMAAQTTHHNDDDAVMQAIAQAHGIDLTAPGLQRGLQVLKASSADEVARQVQALEVTLAGLVEDCRLLLRRWLHRGRQRLHRVGRVDAETALRLRHLADDANFVQWQRQHRGRLPTG